MTKVFNESIADTVVRLTKPSIDGKRFKTKDEAFEFYIAELQKSEEAIIGKMVDRLHNLRSRHNTQKPRALDRGFCFDQVLSRILNHSILPNHGNFNFSWIT